jgi:sarcosine oxidase
MTERYDAIVLGLGGMGSVAAAQLAQRGVHTLGLEQFQANHARGSSHGRSRIIREAYFEAPDYVPLVQRAYALWRELEAETDNTLLTVTGGLNIGLPESEFVSGSKASALLHDLPYEELTAAQVAERFPGFALTDDLVAVFEPNAGFLQPEACVAAHLALAQRHGAELRFDERALRWFADGSGVRVETERGVYTADTLVVTAGPWAGEVLADLGLPLTVRRVVNAHFAPTKPELYDSAVCPVYLISVPEGDYYGFPLLPGEGVKLGRHDVGETVTADTIRRDVDAWEVEQLRALLARYLPGAAGELMWTLTCMYTMTPDAHFILDRHPEHDNVVLGCGFSGHGFKFASAIGEVLAELAIEGRSRHEIEFLSLKRFATAPS